MIGFNEHIYLNFHRENFINKIVPNRRANLNKR